LSASAPPEPSAAPLAGRYWPTRLLAVGGMAEIHLARQGDTDGFARELVVKRLKPKLARDRRLVDMFLDEARLGALFDHPHIVQVSDASDEEGEPFIAMEYVRGEELNELCRRGLGVGRFLPIEHSAEIVRQAALALGYVHALRDGDGRGLDIVHCDVSPTNLLINEDGFVKLIDFGIARARGQRQREQDGLPGKLSYMSPEQVQRRPLDHRSDIFSLGVVLYEIALGRRLFRGPAQEVFERLARCEIQPPTFVRRDFPGALESIIMRALEPAAADRYGSAYDMADELDEFLRERETRSGPLQLARYLDGLVEAIGGTRRPELVPERERRADEEALDFDREVFDGYQASEAAQVPDWDEYDEDEQALADALGVDVGVMRAAAPGSAARRANRGQARAATRPVDLPARPAAAVPVPSGRPPLTTFAFGVVAGAALALLLGFLFG
jgi:serine/threonine protein kinase